MARHQPFPSVNPYFCTCGEGSKVTDSRVKRHFTSVRRRRECLRCGLKWTTREIREDAQTLGDLVKLEAIYEQVTTLKVAWAELQRLLTTRKGVR